MRQLLGIFGTATLLCFLLPVDFADAYMLQHVTLQRTTSRQIVRTAEYLRTLDRNDLLQGERRQRPSDAPIDPQGRLLREPVVRLLRRAKTDPAIVNRQRNVISPTLAPNTVQSTTSTVPVSIETEAFYRNGIKYFRGTGVEADLAYAYMWLNFALADGHPLAREALVQVSRRMNPTQLADAQVRTDVLGTKFLRYRDNREAKIRDDVRMRDLRMIMDALIRYRESKRGQYPVPIPRGDTAFELCRLSAATCVYRMDMRALVPNYIIRIPADPLLPVDGNGTGYYAFLDDEYRLTLFANESETTFILLKEDPR